MKNTDSKFEQHLLQLKPTDCDKLITDTFYQAGWEASARSRVASASSHRWRTVSTLLTGTLCGMVISAGFNSWRDRSVDATSRMPVAANVEPTTEDGIAVVPPVTVGESKRNAIVNWPELTASFLPWQRMLAEPEAGVIPPAAMPLSVAARQQWGDERIANFPRGYSRHAATNEATAQNPVMRAFPATEQRVLELL
ncbi:hypothetical protein [Fuerstiella marisgermanici]|uniref:Uncharacterized protein n=1 Tax=Fuerstiella marisgermanici TaxID=1891926 RepID=A0A1P8WQ84_9PLAN|nr:hypothetical protein [Fuerstiella marisgermanici]APZ96205.1 hypothetical protein Fuma_05873 [Fuerstiella marisgermanici]